MSTVCELRLAIKTNVLTTVSHMHAQIHLNALAQGHADNQILFQNWKLVLDNSKPKNQFWTKVPCFGSP